VARRYWKEARPSGDLKGGQESIKKNSISPKKWGALNRVFNTRVGQRGRGNTRDEETKKEKACVPAKGENDLGRVFNEGRRRSA